MSEKKTIEELEAQLAEMQKEIEQLKNPVETEDKKSDPYKKYEDELKQAQSVVMDILKKMISDGAQGASTVIGAAMFDGTGNGIGTAVFHSLDDMVEDGLAAALDVFTNPRRITILKLLIPKSLTASEISQNTGLVGGQLYHHLSILENAGLIIKTTDKYRTDGRTQTLLCGLYAAVGGMDMA